MERGSGFQQALSSRAWHSAGMVRVLGVVSVCAAVVTSTAAAAPPSPTLRYSAVGSGSTAIYRFDFNVTSDPSGGSPSGRATADGFGGHFFSSSITCLVVKAGHIATFAGTLGSTTFGLTNFRVTAADNGPAGSGLDTLAVDGATTPFDCSTDTTTNQAPLNSGDIVVTESSSPPNSPSHCENGADREVYLVSVLPKGKTKVRVRGIANTHLAGRTVRILRDRSAVGTTVVRPNGSFAATVDAPPPDSRSQSRYQARIATAHTENLKLQRRMVAAHLTRRGTTLTLTGRITAPFARTPARIFLQRYLSCGRRQNVKIKGVRPNADGHFAISFRMPLKSAGVLMYRATTKVTTHSGGRPDTPTFTLPRPIDTP